MRLKRVTRFAYPLLQRYDGLGRLSPPAMIIALNDLAFILGDVCMMLGGYALYIRHRTAKRKKRQREFLARGEA